MEHVARMGELESAHGILVGLREGERSLRKPESKWEDNIKIILRERGWHGFCWIWDIIPWCTAANTVMDFRVYKRLNFFG
jgi:hypothetical protein